MRRGRLVRQCAATGRLDLRGEGGAASEERSCVVCLDGERSHVFVACMHKCVCEGCAELLLARDEWRGTVHAEGAECPLCRVKSTDVRRVFD